MEMKVSIDLQNLHFQRQEYVNKDVENTVVVPVN